MPLPWDGLFSVAAPHHLFDDSELVDPDPRAKNRSGPIRRVDRLGGLLRFYHRAAA